jgi:hypothetical protein
LHSEINCQESYEKKAELSYRIGNVGPLNSAAMPKEDVKDLTKFLLPFPEEVRALTWWLREFVWDLYPANNELIYDNYNALAIGFSPTEKAGDVFCSIAVYSKHVNFGLNRGTEIADPEGVLKGKGSLYRYITIRAKIDLPKVYITRLLREAQANSLARLRETGKVVRTGKGTKTMKGLTLVKSVSKQRRRPM